MFSAVQRLAVGYAGDQQLSLADIEKSVQHHMAELTPQVLGGLSTLQLCLVSSSFLSLLRNILCFLIREF